ncbi:hypothetical protein GY45DRAFT_1360396 [Cubamyces sp. BRFM 1775]|nr:hypothetical protein GY45DRAFT_1360396 [Cubamyces sp. BRFM 1775]
MRTFILISALLAGITTAYASHQGLHNRQVQDPGPVQLPDCAVSCLNQNSIMPGCTISGGAFNGVDAATDAAQCVCNALANGTVQSCLIRTCNSPELMGTVTGFYAQMCQATSDMPEVPAPVSQTAATPAASDGGLLGGLIPGDLLGAGDPLSAIGL